jgi:hypothetical protein
MFGLECRAPRRAPNKPQKNTKKHETQKHKKAKNTRQQDTHEGFKMAEELANAIVAASNKMQRRSPGPTALVGSIRTGHFELDGEEYDFAAQIGTDGPFHTTRCFVGALNYMWEKGHTQMNENDEKYWMELIDRMESSTPGGGRYDRGKILMVSSIQPSAYAPQSAAQKEEEESSPLPAANKSKRKRRRRKNKKKNRPVAGEEDERGSGGA